MSIELARGRLSKAIAKQSGVIKYEGQTCEKCESTVRYTSSGCCVECTFRRKGKSRENRK